MGTQGASPAQSFEVLPVWALGRVRPPFGHSCLAQVLSEGESLSLPCENWELCQVAGGSLGRGGA